MNRITILAIALTVFATATPVFAQNRFADEAAQRQADRIEREAIRRAEHPELYEKAEAKSAGAQEAAAPTQAAEPAAAASEPATPAPAH